MKKIIKSILLITIMIGMTGCTSSNKYTNNVEVDNVYKSVGAYDDGGVPLLINNKSYAWIGDDDELVSLDDDEKSINNSNNGRIISAAATRKYVYYQYGTENQMQLIRYDIETGNQEVVCVNGKPYVVKTHDDDAFVIMHYYEELEDICEVKCFSDNGNIVSLNLLKKTDKSMYKYDEYTIYTVHQKKYYANNTKILCIKADDGWIDSFERFELWYAPIKDKVCIMNGPQTYQYTYDGVTTDLGEELGINEYGLPMLNHFSQIYEDKIYSLIQYAKYTYTYNVNWRITPKTVDRITCYDPVTAELTDVYVGEKTERILSYIPETGEVFTYYKGAIMRRNASTGQVLFKEEIPKYYKILTAWAKDTMYVFGQNKGEEIKDSILIGKYTK